MRVVSVLPLAVSAALVALAPFALESNASADPPPAGEPDASYPPLKLVGLIAYTVHKGDTCAAIAQRYYGDPRRVDLIHDHNALGPPPHHLDAGQILMLPPKPTVAPPSPDARVTYVRNKVEVEAPNPTPAKVDDPLFRGNRVSTEAKSAAGLMFRDETQLRLGEDTLVVILGDVGGEAAVRHVPSETTLVNGSLRAFLAGKPKDGAKETKEAGGITIATPSGPVAIRDGEAQVAVDATKTTRLAMYKGSGALGQGARAMKVPAGFGSKAIPEKPPTPPKPLPYRPVWTTPPPSVAFAFPGADLDLGARYDDGRELRGAGDTGTGGDAAALFHVQVARDAKFDDLVLDTRVTADKRKLAFVPSSPGAYYVRVSAIDADKFEGPYGDVMAITVAGARIVPDGRRATIHFDGGNGARIVCGVDGKTKAPATDVVVERRVAHVVACAPASPPPGGVRIGADGQIPLTPVRLGPFEATMTFAPSGGNTGTARLSIVGPDHHVVEGATIEATATSDVSISPFLPKGPPGDYEARLAWSDGVEGTRVRVVVGGEETAELPEVKFPTRPRTWAELALGGGVALDDPAHLAVGGRAFFRAGIAHAYDAGTVALHLDAAFDETAHLRGGALEDVPSGADRARSTGGDFAVPLSYRFGAREARFAPYAFAGPTLTVQGNRFTPPGVIGRSAYFGILGGIGLELRLPTRDRGIALFGEFAGRDVGVIHDSGGADPSGFVTQAGVRIELGR